MTSTRQRTRPTSPRATSAQATQFRLAVLSPRGTAELDVVRGRGGDYFVVTDDARIVAALIVLEGLESLA